MMLVFFGFTFYQESDEQMTIGEVQPAPG